MSEVAVLFVCLGNICRSPTAEGIFRHLARQRGLEAELSIDSAGTSGWHQGEPSDSRTRAAARRRGITWEHRARRVVPADFTRFDLLVAMDRRNLADLLAAAPDEPARAKVVLLRSYDPTPPPPPGDDGKDGDDLDVPDPYFGGDDGFETVLDLCERSCRGLLDALVRERDLRPR